MSTTPGAPARQVYGRYAVLKLLGEGGMGRVYLGQDPVLQRQVALKVIPVDQHIDRATREDFLKRLALEAKALAQLNHQSIVTVYDVGEEKGVPWIAFEFVQGETLEAVLHREIKLPLARALPIALDIASALNHAHAKKIIHRDIKPANILLEQGTGIAKLTDFGVAKAPWATLTQAGNALGSPGYMSPEQIEGYDLDHRSDIFGLGVVLYEMLAGQHPFLRDTVASTAFATVSGSYVALREVADGVPAEVEEAVNRCLAAKREDRITSQEFIDHLRPFTQWVQTTRSIPAIGGPGAPMGLGSESLRSDLKTGARIGARMATRAGRLLLATGKFLVAAARKAAPLLRMLAPSRTRSTSARPRPPLPRPVFPLRIRIRRALRSVRLQLIVGGCLVLLGAATIGALKTVSLIRSHVSYEDALMAGLNPGKYCPNWPPEKTVNACRALLRKDNAAFADSIASFLANSRKTAAIGSALKGRIALRAERMPEARASFEFAAGLKGGKAALRRERDAILNDFRPKLSNYRAPQEFVSITVDLLQGGDSRLVRSWTGSESYWLRWNAVRILQAARKRVDMVPVYIQDLGNAGGMKSRVEAAEKLGELKDKRAIPHLKKSAAKGWRDPFVSAAAKEALEEISGK